MMDQRLQRRDCVSETDMDGDLFLVDGRNGEIYHLDAMGQALWRALAEPVTGDELADLFVTAFPDQAPAQVSQDVRAALIELLNRDLVVSV